jgi:Uma2 family endonuclease
MAQQVKTTDITADALMALGSDARVEVVDGEIVEMSPVGELHLIVAENLHDILRPYAKQHRLGPVYSDGLIYVLKQGQRGQRSARGPDISFVRKERVPPGRDIRRPLRIAPTLAVEVFSPDENMEDTLKRVIDFLDAGTEQVWLVYPVNKQIHIYRHGVSHIQVYTEGDVMNAGDLFPGLTIALADVFALPTWG